jgi:hypothetical protein
VGPHCILRRNAFRDKSRGEHKTALNVCNGKLEARLNGRSPIGPHRNHFVMILFEFRSLRHIVVMRGMAEMGMSEAVVMMVTWITGMNVRERSPDRSGSLAISRLSQLRIAAPSVLP